MLKIRFKRAGRRNRPVFMLVAAESSLRRDSGLAEKLCTFERTVGHETGVYMTEKQKDRINFLLAHGAQLTETCFRFLKKINRGIVIPEKMRHSFESVLKFRIDNNLKKLPKKK